MKKSRTNTLSSVLLLVSVISSGQALSDEVVKKSGVDVFAASVTSIEHLGDGSQPVSFLYDRPVISPSSIELLTVDDKTLTINVKVSKDEAKAINSFLEKYPDKRMVFVSDGKLLFAPKIKAKLTGEAVQISFKDQFEYRHAVGTLTNVKQGG